MRYLLDTNIISNITKPSPSAPLLDWMAKQRYQDLFISSLTIAEISKGVLEKPPGKRRDELEAWLHGPEGPQRLFADRILTFDENAGLIWARLMADAKTRGRPRSALDAIIAAVAEANDCVVVTNNERDFEEQRPLFHFVSGLAFGPTRPWHNRRRNGGMTLRARALATFSQTERHRRN